MRKQQESIQYSEIIEIISIFVEFVGIIIDDGFLCTLAMFCFLIFIAIESWKLYKDLINDDWDVKSAFEINMYRAFKTIIEDRLTDANISKEERGYWEKIKGTCAEKMIEMREKSDCKKKEQVKKRFVKIVIGIAIFLITIVVCGDTIYTYAQNLRVTLPEIISGNRDNLEDDISLDAEKENNENSSDNQEQETETQQGEIEDGKTFHLNGPHKEETASDRVSDIVFYVHCNDENVETNVCSHIKELLVKKNVDTYNGNLGETESDLIVIIDKTEKEFNTAVDLAKEYAKKHDYEGWKDALGDSVTLDNIIEWRESIWEDGFCNANLASLIANDYQQLAMEYQFQMLNLDSAVYYYMKAIQWSEYALIYEDANEKVIFDYIKARYKDIWDCEEFSDVYRADAEAIYNAMGEYEDYLVEE